MLVSHAGQLQESRRTTMWTRTLMRLLSLSFMSFFVIGLLWQEGRRPRPTAGRKPAGTRKDGTAAPPITD